MKVYFLLLCYTCHAREHRHEPNRFHPTGEPTTSTKPQQVIPDQKSPEKSETEKSQSEVTNGNAEIKEHFLIFCQIINR